MRLEGEQILIRFFVDVEKKVDFLFPLYRHLVNLAIKSNLSGLTVIKGIKGFVKEKDVKILNLIEVVDRPESVNSYLEKCANSIEDIIFSVERAHVFIYRTKSDERGAKKSLSIIDTANISRKKEVTMFKTSEKVLIRIFIGDSDRDKESERHLFDLIFEEAKKEGFLVGVVYKGIMGFGKAGRIRAIETVELSGDLPVIIEIIGDEDRIDNFLKFCDKHVDDGLITMEKVMIYDGS